jgi:outer membrane usher protein
MKRRPYVRAGCGLIGLVALCILLLPSSSLADQTIIVSVTVNQLPQGDRFIVMADDGDFLVATKDLRSMGIMDPPGRRSTINGEEYCSLRSMQGVSVAFDDKSLTLKISVPPALLPSSMIDLTPQRPAHVLYPRDRSAFLNYGVSYTDSTGGNYGTLNVASQAGIRTGDVLFLSDSTYTRTATDDSLVRLMSSFVYDRRDRMERIILGDLSATSGSLGSSIMIGGLSYAKVYSINPYFITYPTLEFSGLAPLPSTVEIYMNGMLYRTEQVAPGPFDLKNITMAGGGNLMELVIRDPFGNEQRVRNPFYTSETLLAKGLHEYSYNAGFLRENYGVQSNDYGDPAYAIIHRYGMRKDASIGIHAEGTTGLNTVGPELTYQLHRSGVVTLSASESVRHDQGAYAGSLVYQYTVTNLSARLFLRDQSRDYATISSLTVPDQVRMTVGGAVGLGTGELGSVSLEYSRQDDYGDRRRQVSGISYSRGLGRDFSLTVSAQNVREERATQQFFLAVTYSPKRQTALSARHQSTRDRMTDTLEITQTAPVGEGLGYRAAIDRTATDDGQRTTSFSPSVQYNSRYNIFRGDYRVDQSTFGTTESYMVTVSGAVVAAGTVVGVTRPVTDSFALVQAGDLPGVHVSVNGQDFGTTDSSGRLFVPGLGSYVDNRITISDQDVPVNYSLAAVSRVVSPPLQSGSCVFFPAARTQPVTGRLRVQVPDGIKPVEFTKVSLTAGGRNYSFMTAGDGEFYLEQLVAEEEKAAVGTRESECGAGDGGPRAMTGAYTGTFEYQGRSCSFELFIPLSNDMIIDLGEKMTCYLDGAPRPTAPLKRQR